MRPRMALAALAPLALLLSCSRSSPALPEVRLYASPRLPAAILADAALRFGVARVVAVGRVEEAELAWLADPTEAVELGARAVPGSAPAQPDVLERWKDPEGRFAPLGARARVLLAGAAELPVEARGLRDLGDRRLRGQVALVPFDRGDGPATIAAVALTYGADVALAWIAQVAANEPQLVDDGEAVRARVATGAAQVGFAGSIEGAAGAASASALRVIWPDQAGVGAVVLPTVVARLAGAGEGAARLAEWLAGAPAERVLVARVPGLLPLRPETPVPVGVEPVANVSAIALDWDRLAEEKARLAPALERWAASAHSR